MLMKRGPNGVRVHIGYEMPELKIHMYMRNKNMIPPNTQILQGQNEMFVNKS